MNDFPETISYKDLSVKHEDYNKNYVLDRYEALYTGGPLFSENIEKFKFLDKRSLDGGISEPSKRLDVENPDTHMAAAKRFSGMGNRWEYKKSVCRYTNYVAGMLDYFVQGVFKDDPCIIADGDYWPKLNDDADGCGSNLSTVGRAVLLNALKFRRAYLSVIAPEVQASNRAEQRKAGGLEPRINVLSAADVDLWETRGKKLLWVRTYRKDGVRTAVYGNPSLVRELWTYITDKELVEYEVIYDPRENAPKPNDKIARKSRKPHGFLRLPVIPLQINADLWAMQRLEDPALKLYNREAAMTCLLNDAAFQVFTISTDNPPGSVPDTSAGALWLGQGGTAGFQGPQGAAFDAQNKDAELCKNNLYEVFQAMGVNALATQGQNARQSDVAKARDKEPLYALLITFGFSAKSALKSAIELAAEFREEPAPELGGLSDFDSKSLSEKLQNVLNAQKAKGFPETAMRWMLRDTALDACATAPSEIKKKIETEAEEADVEMEVPSVPDASVSSEKNKENDISVDNENGKG